MRHDILSDAMITINNADNSGKKECIVSANKLVKDILKILYNSGYIQEFEFIDNKKGGLFRVSLLNKINVIKVVRPRFSIKKDEFEKWERRYLPSVKMGIIFLSTPKGVVTHIEANKMNIGGKIIGYIY